MMRDPTRQLGNMTKVRIMLYDMKQLFMGCVKVYLKLDEDNEPKGQSQSIAAKVIMDIWYGARMAIRPSTFL